jgi:hypothetical protein
MAHNYDVGTKAWQPDVSEGWVASEVISKTERDGKTELVFELANGEVRMPTTCFKDMLTEEPCRRRGPYRSHQQISGMTTARNFLR